MYHIVQPPDQNPAKTLKNVLIKLRNCLEKNTLLLKIAKAFHVVGTSPLIDAVADVKPA